MTTAGSSTCGPDTPPLTSATLLLLAAELGTELGHALRQLLQLPLRLLQPPARLRGLPAALLLRCLQLPQISLN